MKKATILLLCFVSLLLGMTSCRSMKTATPVGNFRSSQGSTYTYAKGKQIYLFWGYVRLGRTSVATPANGDCCIRTYVTFWDRILTGLTGGIISAQSIAVDAKRIPVPAQSNMIQPQSTNQESTTPK